MRNVDYEYAFKASGAWGDWCSRLKWNTRESSLLVALFCSAVRQSRQSAVSRRSIAAFGAMLEHIVAAILPCGHIKWSNTSKGGSNTPATIHCCRACIALQQCRPEGEISILIISSPRTKRNRIISASASKGLDTYYYYKSYYWLPNCWQPIYIRAWPLYSQLGQFLDFKQIRNSNSNWVKSYGTIVALHSRAIYLGFLLFRYLFVSCEMGRTYYRDWNSYLMS